MGYEFLPFFLLLHNAVVQAVEDEVLGALDQRCGSGLDEHWARSDSIKKIISRSESPENFHKKSDPTLNGNWRQPKTRSDLIKRIFQLILISQYLKIKNLKSTNIWEVSPPPPRMFESIIFCCNIHNPNTYIGAQAVLWGSGDRQWGCQYLSKGAHLQI